MNDSKADRPDPGGDKPDPAHRKRGPKPGQPTALGREVQAKIGQHLRSMYDDVVKEGVPDHLADLLRQLDKPGEPRG